MSFEPNEIVDIRECILKPLDCECNYCDENSYLFRCQIWDSYQESYDPNYVCKKCLKSYILLMDCFERFRL